MLKKKTKSNRAALIALAVSLGSAAALPMETVATLGWGAILCVAASAPARAASTVPIERVADGRVVTKSDTPIPGAIVFLKDSRAQSIRTYICDQQGHFHFGELSQNTDYELWAQSNGVRSPVKSISSFDSKNDYNFTLKINTAK
jgi:hypothetical protein